MILRSHIPRMYNPNKDVQCQRKKLINPIPKLKKMMLLRKFPFTGEKNSVLTAKRSYRLVQISRRISAATQENDLSSAVVAQRNLKMPTPLKSMK